MDKKEMKQTAVEWLVENAEDFLGNLIAPSIIEQAKAMEREQMEQHIRRYSPYPSGKQGDVDWKNGFERGVEWYREQLKQRL